MTAEDRPPGVWIVHYFQGSIIPFLDPVEALQYLSEHGGMGVGFAPFGQEFAP